MIRKTSSSGSQPKVTKGNVTNNDNRSRRKKKNILSTHYDDGGADKSSARKLRRERKWYSRALLSSLALGFVFLLFTRSRDHKKMAAWHRFQRVGAVRGLMEEMSENSHHIHVSGGVRGSGDEQRDGWDGRAVHLNRHNRAPKKRSPPQTIPVGMKDINVGHWGNKWTNPKMLPPLPGKKSETEVNPLFDSSTNKKFKPVLGIAQWRQLWDASKATDNGIHSAEADWELEAREVEGAPGSEAATVAAAKGNEYHGTGVDYTTHSYHYPELIPSPPMDGTYPPLERLGDLMKRWPQDALDDPPSPFIEQLMHFDYMKPEQLEMAHKYRDAELPFKVYNVPEIQNANKKWSDDYVSMQFDGVANGDKRENTRLWDLLTGKAAGIRMNGPRSTGTCQESHNNFFAFFSKGVWDVKLFGPPPTLDTAWSYAKWSRHARHADRVKLEPDKMHYYWQSGVPREERMLRPEAWTFVSRDLPSWSSNKETFFSFHPEDQKGIQCRFGERGVTAATHFDGGRNMVAMVVGAKRYILAPPNACSQLGVVNTRGHPTVRHSLLNFAHLDLLRGDMAMKDDMEGMSEEEKEWLERAYESRAIDTVLKAGEVLYIPSYWFHYITSLQKSAQCNVRSGMEKSGTPAFGGLDDVNKCDTD